MRPEGETKPRSVGGPRIARRAPAQCSLRFALAYCAERRTEAGLARGRFHCARCGELTRTAPDSIVCSRPRRQQKTATPGPPRPVSRLDSDACSRRRFCARAALEQGRLRTPTSHCAGRGCARRLRSRSPHCDPTGSATTLRWRRFALPVRGLRNRRCSTPAQRCSAPPTLAMRAPLGGELCGIVPYLARVSSRRSCGATSSGQVTSHS